MPVDIERARELVESAIDAPWTVDVNLIGECTVLDGNGCWVAMVGKDPNSALFIAAARTLVGELLDEATTSRALRAELVRLRAAWNEDQGLRADRRFVDAVCALLDQEPG